MNPCLLERVNRFRTARVYLALAVCCASMAVSTDVEASLTSGDLFGAGDGLVTHDSATHLHWLDVSATVGQPVSEVLRSRFVTALGFRYATDQEVLALWRNAGATGPFVYNPAFESYIGNFAAARLLVALMGCTSDVLGVACDGIDQNWHIGWYSTQAGQFGSGVVDYFGPPDYRAGTGAMLIDFAELVAINTRLDIGSYLVRDTITIPEPATYALIGAALLGFAAARRRTPATPAR